MLNLETQKDDELKEATQGKTYQVSLSERIFEQLSTGQRATWGQRFQQDLEAYSGIQWSKEDSASQKADGWTAIPDHEATAAIEQLIAALTSKSPRWSATGRNDADIEDANHISELLTYIWGISHGGLRLKSSVQDYQVGGMFAMMPYFDSYADDGKGEILIKDINPLHLYISPNSTDPLTKDATHKIISVVLTGEMVQAQYPKVNLKDAEESEDTDPTGTAANNQDTVFKVQDTDHKKYRVIDRYTKVLIPMFNIWDPFSQKEYNFNKEDYIAFSKEKAVIETTVNSVRYITDPEEVEQQLQIIDEYGPQYHFRLGASPDGQTPGQPEMVSGMEDERGIPESTTELEVTTINDLLYQGAIKVNEYKATRIQRVLSVGGVQIEDSILDLDTHPIVTAMPNHRRNPFPMSNLRKVKPIIEQIIFFRSILVKHTSRSTNTTVIIGKGAHNLEEMKKKLNSPSVELIEVDWELPGGQPFVLYPQQLSNELFTYIRELKYEIQRILGSYEAGDGSPQGAYPTKGGLLAQDEMRMRRTEATRKDIESALNELGNVVTQMIPNFYTERKAFKITGENGKPKQVVLNDPQQTEEGIKIFNDTTNVNYTAQFIAGSMLPNLRWAKVENMKELWQLGVLQIADPIIRSSEIDDAEEIIAQQNENAQLKQMLKQLDEENKKLAGQLQSKSREVISANENVAATKTIEKFKTDVGGMRNELMSEVKIAKAEINKKENSNGNN